MQSYAQLSNNAPSEEEAYQMLGLRPDMSLLEQQQRLLDMQSTIQEQIKAHQNTQPQWIQSSNIKDNTVRKELSKKLEIIRALLQNVKKAIIKQKQIAQGSAEQRQEEKEKLQKKVERASAGSKQDKNVQEEPKSSSKNKKKKVFVPSAAILVPTTYFACHVNVVTSARAEIAGMVARMALNAGKALSQKDLNEFVDTVYAIKHEMGLITQLIPKPELFLGITKKGELGVILDATAEQYDEICRNCRDHFGLDIRQENALNANAAADNVVENQNQNWAASKSNPYAVANPYAAPTPKPSAPPAEEDDPKAHATASPASSIRSPFATPTLTVKVPGT